MATAADGQLRLDIVDQKPGDKGAGNAASDSLGIASDVNLVEAYLVAHAGDARAAIRELLLDADFLRDQLAIASAAMSAGMTRGWRPKYERV
jgi:hypothetical protein